MNTQSATPRTDKVESETAFLRFQQTHAFILARTLERELNAAKQISEKYEDRYFQAQQLLNAANERIKRLEEASHFISEHIATKVEKCLNCGGSGQNHDGEGLLNEACPDCAEDRIALALYADKAKEITP
jgi:hypothetical protein